MEHRREPKSSRRGRNIHPEMESIEERMLLSRLGATVVVDLLGHSRSAMIRGRDHGSPPRLGRTVKGCGSCAARWSGSRARVRSPIAPQMRGARMRRSP